MGCRQWRKLCVGVIEGTWELSILFWYFSLIFAVNLKLLFEIYILKKQYRALKEELLLLLWFQKDDADKE